MAYEKLKINLQPIWQVWKPLKNKTGTNIVALKLVVEKREINASISFQIWNLHIVIWRKKNQNPNSWATRVFQQEEFQK